MPQVNTTSCRLENIFAPRSLPEVSAILARYGDEIKPLAAGTDLILGQSNARYLVDLSRLGLNYVKKENKHLAIGSMTTITDIADSDLFNAQPYSIIKAAALLFGSSQIRNRATIGGNICSAVPSADMPVALIALDARVETFSSEGERTIQLEKFIVDYRQTDMRKGEFLKEIQIPLFGIQSRGAFSKLGRTSVDIALVNCAVRSDPVDSDFRIVLGAVGPTPIRARDAEGFLRECGEVNGAKLFEAAKIASEESKPISDLRASAAYRKEISKLLVYRSLKQVFEF